MRRILPLTLLCAGASLSQSALAGNYCTKAVHDPQLTFPGTSKGEVFGVVPNSEGSYTLNLCSSGALDISWLTAYTFADFNHDGFEDLLFGRSSNSGGAVKLFLNDKTGSGTVVLSATLLTGAGVAPSEIDTLDLDSDGSTDIITANGSEGSFTVMLNDGSGAFTSVKLYPVASDVAILAAEDVNGDGIPDVITESALDHTVSVSINNGDGTFATRTYPVGGSVATLTVGDLNGDGHPDIYVASAGVDTSFTLGPVTGTPGSQKFLNNGDGTFTASAWKSATNGSGAGAGGSITISGAGVTVTANSFVGMLGSGSTVVPPIMATSGTGQIKLPDPKLKLTVVTASSGKGKTSTGTGSTGGSKSSATASSSGGGAMEWLGLTLLGLAAFLRRKRV
jgi:VCBS repeat protein